MWIAVICIVMKYKYLFIAFFSIICIANIQAQHAQILITNGHIINGTGNSWILGDIAIVKDKIVAIGRLTNWTADRVINARENIVAPGFIDVHTHIEGDEIVNPFASNFIHDGVTTVITGNCGSSKLPIVDYLSFIDSLKLSVNVATLAGHNDIRRWAMGDANRKPTPLELFEMQEQMQDAMEQGALGLSTGLIYAPGMYANTEEISTLAKEAAKYHGIYATHIRDEADSVVPAIYEALAVCKEAKIPLEISHFKVSGPQNWGRSLETLSLIESARALGLEVVIDQYPYTASSTSLSTMLPDDVLEGGYLKAQLRLKENKSREYAVAYMLAKLAKRKLEHFGYAIVAQYKSDTTYQGKSIESINLIMGKPHTALAEANTIIDLLIQSNAGMVFHGMSDIDIAHIAAYPFTIPASDASIRIFGEGQPHPRGYGTNSRFIRKMVNEENIVSLEEAIRRMTSLPAQHFNLPLRGMLLPGYFADIVIFDANKITDHATYEQPHQYASGFDFVIVNGVAVLEADVQNNQRPGQVIFGPGYIKK